MYLAIPGSEPLVEYDVVHIPTSAKSADPPGGLESEVDL